MVILRIDAADPAAACLADAALAPDERCHAVAMTQEEFIVGVRRWVFEGAASENALQPAGRKPHKALVTLWDWYTALSERDKALVQHAMRISAYGALFGVFAMIDGVRQVDDQPHGELKLSYVTPDGIEHPLSGPGLDLDELHSLWTAEVFPYAEALPE